MNGIDGREVRRRREERGWTQQHLAELAGLDQATISRIEQEPGSRLYLDTVERLAEVFRCHVGDLLSSRERNAPKKEYTEASTLAGWELPEWDQLTEDERADVEAFVQFVLSRRGSQRRRGA